MSSTRIWFSPRLDSLIATGIRLIFLDSFLANLSFLLAFSQLNLFLIIIHNTYIYIYTHIFFCLVALMLLLSFSIPFSSCFLRFPFALRFHHFPPPVFNVPFLSLSLPPPYSFLIKRINSEDRRHCWSRKIREQLDRKYVYVPGGSRGWSKRDIFIYDA